MVKPITIHLPFYKPETDSARCFNASVLVRHPDGSLNSYIESNEDIFELAYRQSTGCNGDLVGCKLKPYSWDCSDVYPILVTPNHEFEDPRLWIFNGQTYLSCTQGYGKIVFAPFHFKDIEPSSLVTVFPQSNGAPGTVVQKNWGFFQHKHLLCFVFVPGIDFQVAEMQKKLSSANEKEDFVPVFISTCNKWTTEPFRGGSSPVYLESENLFYIFCHKMCDYNVWAIAFRKDSHGKWIVVSYTPQQINTQPDDRKEIHFVSGAVFDRLQNQWILTGGLRDTYMGVWIVPHEELLRKMVPYLMTPVNKT
jgi:hypothetical protein